MMRIILIIFIIVAIFPKNAICCDLQVDTFHMPYLKDALAEKKPCPYNGESYFYATWQIYDSVGGVDMEYRFCDCEPDYQYDNNKMRQKLIKMLNEKEGLGNKLFTNSRNLFKNGICLNAWYELPGNPDFVLLKYYNAKARDIFIGLVKSSQELFLFEDTPGESLKNIYNETLKSNPGILNLEPLCRAALIVSLTYGDGNIVILDSIPDLYPALVVGAGHYDDIEYPFDPDQNELYIFDILQHKNIMEYTDYLYKTPIYSEDDVNKIKDAIAEKGLYVIPPEIIESDSGVIVELTAYNSNLSHIGWWRVEFDSSGILLDRQLVDSLTAVQFYRGRTYNPPKEVVIGR
jgi:hypothetical protein